MRLFSSHRLARRRQRQGNYALMFGMGMTVMLGFGAFAIDLSYLRLAQDQVQDVADAASQAAMITLKRGGTTDQATTAAELMLAQNVVGGKSPTLQWITFGVWDEDEGTYTEEDIAPNAVQLRVTRDGDNAVPMFFSKMWGHDSIAVSGNSTSAARKLHTILLMDITGSWSQRNDAYRTAWGLLNVASKSGTGRTYPSECSTNTTNNFTTPTNTSTQKGGCYPYMPREYTDEPGTDHTTGMYMAQKMFEEENAATVYNAMVLLTDGIPNGIASGHGTIRTQTATKYTEGRWREYLGTRPHTTSNIQNDAKSLATEMWDEMRVNQWVISFVQDGSFMHDMPKGNGTFTLTSSSSQIITVFQSIARSLPLVIVH